MAFSIHESCIIPGCSFVYETENDVHTSSAIEAIYQFGIQNTRDNMLAEMLEQILKEPAFDQLRTKVI